MKYKLPVVIIPLGKNGFLARCELVKANATGNTHNEAIENLREAIDDLIKEYGEASVFQDISPEGEVQVLEVAI
jgi:predicted RNase H-like HicB family nuclease